MSAWVKTKELSGDDKLEYLREKYKDRNLLEELGWGAYCIHSGYLSKADADFLNWLCNAAYREIKGLRNGRSNVAVPRDGSEAEEAEEGR